MGKKKKGDKKGESLPEAPPPPQGVSEIAEAVLNFKIHTRELLIEEHGNEAEFIRDKNYHQTERNKKLLEEKESYLKTLIEQFREHEAKLHEARKVSHTDVEAALLEKMSYLHTSIQDIKDMGEAIEQLDSELAVNSEELQRIQHYKNVEMIKNNSRIETVKKEMNRIQEEGAKQEAEVNEKLKEIREDVQQLTEIKGEMQQKEIFKRLLDSLQPDVKQELKDNIWLKREIGLQRKAFDKLSQENAFLEQRNLKLMDRMYKMKMEDLRAMRKVCQPEMEAVRAPQDTSMPKLSSTNMLWKEVTEETAKEKLPAAYTSLELRMMGVDGVRAHLSTPPDAVKLPPIAAGKTQVAAATRPYWPVTSNMLNTLLTSNETSNSSQTSTLP